MLPDSDPSQDELYDPTTNPDVNAPARDGTASEPISLYDGEPSASIIVHDRATIPAEQTIRGRRTDPRKSLEGAWVLFAPEVRIGQPDQVECPLVNISAGGFAVYYDRVLKAGVRGYVSYRSICDLPIRVGFTVQRCKPKENGLFLVGAKFDHRLRYEDRRPATVRRGREVVPGIRARRIKMSALREAPSTLI